MTQEREELLISDVAEMKGMVNRFLGEWDGRKEYIASKIDVACVDKKIDDHIGDGRHKANAVGTWVASLSAVALAVISIFAIRK